LRRFFAYLMRLAVILAGFAAGAAACSLFINILLFSTIDILGENFGTVSRPDFWVSVTFFTLYSAYLAFIPVCILIVYSELLARRDWLFYALGGGASALFVLVWAWADPGAHPATANPGFAAAVIAAGMVGGMAYWAVAGRTAGAWLHGDRREEASADPDAPVN
jgi:hypothetical protein